MEDIVEELKGLTLTEAAELVSARLPARRTLQRHQSDDFASPRMTWNLKRTECNIIHGFSSYLILICISILFTFK